MSGNVLDHLLSDELLANAGAFSTGAALRQFFAHAPEVGEVRRALQQETITEDSIRDFATTLLTEVRKGVFFRHDLTLGALAVALEGRQGLFVEEFLRDLAGWSLAEMPLGPRVAREVLKQRHPLAPNQADGVLPPTQPRQPIDQPQTQNDGVR
jgi:hypothetical protein